MVFSLNQQQERSQHNLHPQQQPLLLLPRQQRQLLRHLHLQHLQQQQNQAQQQNQRIFLQDFHQGNQNLSPQKEEEPWMVPRLYSLMMPSTAEIKILPTESMLDRFHQRRQQEQHRGSIIRTVKYFFQNRISVYFSRKFKNV